MSRKILGGVDNNNQRLINLADASAATDAVTLQQVQAYIRGLDWKASVRAATVANITLTGTQTVDGVVLVAGDRVLAKDQSTAATNGIYIVAAGAWARATDFDDSVEVTASAAIPVEEGTTNGDAVFITTNNGAITVGTTALAFTRLGGSGVSYTAGSNGGLTLSGSAFSILLDTGSGLVLGAGGIKLDTTQFAALGLLRKYSGTLPASATPAVAHGLNTVACHVTVYETASGAEVDADVVHTSASTISLTFASAPSAGFYSIVISG